MRTFFTADLHFFHKNIIKYCNRPFSSAEDMYDELIKNWNERVKNEDLVIIIGDFGFCNATQFETLNSHLNGRKIFIKGNHDSHNVVKTRINNLVYEWAGIEMFCVHNPKHHNDKYKINLVGHIHQHWKVKKIKKLFRKPVYLVNVGVDVWGFKPILMEEIMREIKNNT